MAGGPLLTRIVSTVELPEEVVQESGRDLAIRHPTHARPTVEVVEGYVRIRSLDFAIRAAKQIKKSFLERGSNWLPVDPFEKTPVVDRQEVHQTASRWRAITERLKELVHYLVGRATLIRRGPV